MDCPIAASTKRVTRRCVCGGSAISGSSIAKITDCLSFSSAMKVSSAKTNRLMEPVPSRPNGTRCCPGCAAMNRRTTSRRYSRVKSDAKNAVELSPGARLTKWPMRDWTSARTCFNCSISPIAGSSVCLQPAERVLPHLDGASSAELQDRIEQRAPLQAERSGSRPERPQKHKAAKPLMHTR
jgi:hypothetical protein